ncbi:MAG: hypothetical protein RIC87_06515 [Kiloniellales bacterium]
MGRRLKPISTVAISRSLIFVKQRHDTIVAVSISAERVEPVQTGFSEGLDHDRAVFRELSCRTTPQEAMAVWGKFAATAAKRYVQEMSKMASPTVDQARETVAEVQHEIEQAATIGGDGKAG